MRSLLNRAWFFVFLGLNLLLSQGRSALGQNIFEPFNYPLDSSLSGGTGGTGWLAGSGWQLGGNADGAIIVPGMTFSGTRNTLATQGNAVQLSDVGNYPYDDIIGRQIAPTSAITSGNLWMSYLVYMPTVDNGGEFFGARVNSSAAGWWNSALFQVDAKVSNTVNPGISGFLNPSNPPTTTANNAILPSTIYLVVAEFQGLATYSGTGQIWVLNTSNLDKLNFANGGPTVANLNANNVSTATCTGTYPTWLDASDYLQFSDYWGANGFTGNYTVNFGDLRAGPSVSSVLVLSNTTGNWQNDAAGNWSSAGNWNGNLPNGGNSQAIFGNVITAPRTVTLDIPVSVGSLTFNSTNAYTLSGTPSITMLSGSGDATINVSAGNHLVSVPLVLSTNIDFTIGMANTLTMSGNISGGNGLNMFGPGTLVLTGSNTYGGGTNIFAGTLAIGNGGSGGSLAGNLSDNGTLLFNLAGSPTFAGQVSGSGGLVMNGPGVLALTGGNTYTGGTTVSSGTLQGNTSSLQGSITNNATVNFNQAANGTYAGSISGSGGVTKSGSASLTVPGADTFAFSGGIAINQGTLTAPYGISHGGSLITIASGATLQAGGQINRAVSGNGTVTATANLIIGAATQSGQFNQGGAAGVGGTLNVGGNAVAVFSSSTAILGSQTNIGAGGSLSALNGAQLGNPTSVDATKVLTATGSASINADFVNNGVVNGPSGAGQELTFTQAVQGAGSTTGNVEYAASYRFGNSPNAVSAQNVLLDPTSTLIMEIAGDTPGSGYDQLDIAGLATLNGTLELTYLGGFSPSAGDSFDFINGPTTGRFSEISLPPLSSGMNWNTSNLYTNGTISVVPEPSAFVLLAAGATALLGWRWRRQTRRVLRTWCSLSLLALATSTPCRTALAAPGPGQLLLTITDPNPSMGSINRFGTAVATLGNEAVISAPTNTTDGNGAGLVYLYSASSGNLNLTLHNPAPTGEVTEFGSALATIGNNIVVGTPRAQDSATSFSGYGAVYQFSSITGSLLTTSGGSTQLPSGTGFGTAVAVDGPNLLIGDPGRDPAQNGGNYGAVFVASSASGALSGTISRTSPVAGEEVGTSIAAGNGYILVGAPNNSTYAADAGAAYMFNDSTHAQLLALASGDRRKSEQFGFAVTLSGSNLFVGAPNVGSTGSDYSGAVYEFNAATGSLLHTFRNPTTGGYDWFGYSLAVVNGDLLIGSPADNSAFLYDIPTGDLLDTFVDQGPSTSVGFGYSVAGFNNGNFLIGAPGMGGNNDIGAAYVFNAVVPEPSSLALVVTALSVALFATRRKIAQ